MKRIIYFRLHHLFTVFNFKKVFGFLLHYLETFVYFTSFSAWLKDKKPPILDDKKKEKNHTKRRFQLHQKIFESENLHNEISYLEFGVASGTSLKWWVDFNSNSSSEFFGFDTFEGLPEDWFSNKKGDFNQDGKYPNIDDSRLKYIKGLYQNTLFDFLKDKPLDKRKVIHIDADLYSSTLFVLTTLHPYLKKDDIIIFDDFSYLMGEYRALLHYVNAYYVNYEVIGSVNNYAQIAIKIC